jgi:hypothetical protein
MSPQLFESNTAAAPYGHVILGVEWKGQTFTPLKKHRITSVKLKMRRFGSPGTVTVSIRATSGGVPVGEDLCSGTIDGNTLTTATGGAVYEISLGDGAILKAGVQYAIVARAPSGDGSNYVTIYASDNTYPRGTEVYSSNSGSTWERQSSYDLYFEDWGILIEKPSLFKGLFPRVIGKK